MCRFEAKLDCERVFFCDHRRALCSTSWLQQGRGLARQINKVQQRCARSKPPWAALREYAALKEKVSSAAGGTRAAAGSGNAGADFDASELGEKAQQLKSEDPERCHNAWAKVVYDVKEVYQAIGFHRRQDNVSLRSFVTSHCLGFFSDLLETKVPDPVNTSLRSACPFIIAEAAGRASVANGLPRDGHVVFSTFQGQCAYYWNGLTGGLRNPPGRD